MMTYSCLYNVIIIGGGASGLMLAANLDLRQMQTAFGTGKNGENGGNRLARGVILEKTGRIGTKILMSGGGRCNITHGGSIKDFMNAYGDAGPRMRKCLYRHSNIELAKWMEDHGISLADEKGNAVRSDDLSRAGRIFPESMKAADILEVLRSQVLANGWEIRTNEEVYDIQPDDQDAQLSNAEIHYGCANQLWRVKTVTGRNLTACSVVIATGGRTFPETGSDGSMMEIVRNLGAEIVSPRSALAPVYVEDYPYEELSGISIPDVTVTAFGTDTVNTCKGKAARMTGDLLFTHRGFSGPVVLNISKYAEPGQVIRFKYNKSLGELPKRMQRILEKRAAGPSGDVRTNLLARLLDQDDFTVSAVDECGMVTAGGISLGSIDTKSMELKLPDPLDGSRLSGLYAIGEAIDADGITGGYNLQMCWSTACTAADHLFQHQI